MMNQHAHFNQISNPTGNATNSHLLMQDFDYMEASSIEQALTWLEQYHAPDKNIRSVPSQARLLAGGTDLVILMKMGRMAPQALINISKIPGLNEITLNSETRDISHAGSVSIGPLVTIHTLATHPLVNSIYPGLAMACSSFGSTQVEQMGTLGGNLCNASPAADTAPVLLALRAKLTLASRQGKRVLPLEDFFLGPGKTALRPDEMLVEITLPIPEPGSTSVFLKSSRVAADLAKASLAVALTRQGNRITACWVAMGSVAPTPTLLPEAARALEGQDFSPELLAEAGRLAASTISPIDDIRSSARYRRQMANVLLQDAMTIAFRQAAAPRQDRTALDVSPLENTLRTRTSGVFRRSVPIVNSLPSTQRQEIELNVNGCRTKVWVTANELLLNVLREKLELTGTKYACGIGECSACTIQVDGKPMLSCLILAVSASGKEITTIEGLQDPKTGALDPLQQAFIDNTAFQCGYCTPGILMTARALLNETPAPDEKQVRHYLRGNHCRCTGYASIVRAVLDAASGQEHPPTECSDSGQEHPECSKK